MDWIALTLTPKKTNILQDLQNLQIREDTKPKALESFRQETFKSTYLLKQFRHYHYTDLTPDTYQPPLQKHQKHSNHHCPPHSNELLNEFALRLPTQYQNISIFVTVSLSESSIKYHSYPLKGTQMLVLSREQTTVFSHFFSYHVNARLNSGFISVDPASSSLSHQIVNNYFGHLQRRLMKEPEQLTNQLAIQIKQIQKFWKTLLPTVFQLLSQNEKKSPCHQFWETFVDKRAYLGIEQQSHLSSFVKQSHIEFPEMFDQQLSEPATARTRYKLCSRREKVVMHRAFRENSSSYLSKYKHLTREVSKVLQLFVGEVEGDEEEQAKLISQQKIKQICESLKVDRYESRLPVLSKLKINEIRGKLALARSGFSELQIWQIQGQKVEETEAHLQFIVAKATQQSRHINETQILKFIGAGKSHFITRYFQNEAHAEKILMEYCPQRSIDDYLFTHKKFVSFETKIYFLYEIAHGLKFLRDHGVTHNDLKPQNVLLKIVGPVGSSFRTFMARLIDLGESFSKYQEGLFRGNQYRRGFTVPYASPQQVHGDFLTEKNDIFSLGVMIYEFVFDVFPAEVVKRRRDMFGEDNLYWRMYALAPQRCKADSFPNLMMLLYQLVMRCLHPDEDIRPSIDWVAIILKEVLETTKRITSF